MTNRLASYFDAADAASQVLATMQTDSPQEPRIYSFAEWAPRIRAEKRAGLCPCRRTGSLCSVCRERG